MNEDPNPNDLPPEPDESALEASFASLDAIGGDDEPPADTKPTEIERKPPIAEPKPDPEPQPPKKGFSPEDDLDELAGKQDPEPKPSEAPAAPQDVEPKTPKELRERYNLTKQELATLKAQTEELRRAKEEGTAKEVEEATKALKVELDQIRQSRDDLDTRVRYHDYRQSDDYKARFQQPIANAWAAMVEDASSVEVETDDGGVRRLTQQELNSNLLKLVRLPNIEASKLARRMFGEDGAPIMMDHRRQIVKLQKDALTEQQVWKERGKEYYDNQQKRQDLIRSKADTTFQEEVDSAVKKWPELFDKDDDKEGNEYMDKSEAFVRAAFHGEGLDPALTEEQRVVAIAKAQAHLALRAKAYSRERLRVNRLRTELDKVKAELAKVKASEPSGGGRQDSGNASRHHRNPEDAIDDIPAIA